MKTPMALLFVSVLVAGCSGVKTRQEIADERKAQAAATAADVDGDEAGPIDDEAVNDGLNEAGIDPHETETVESEPAPPPAVDAPATPIPMVTATTTTTRTRTTTTTDAGGKKQTTVHSTKTVKKKASAGKKAAKKKAPAADAN